MALQVEYVGINTIKGYKGNAKLHPKEQIEQIKKSIQDYGMNDPVGVWHNEVVEGHGRLKACKELGFKEIPIIRLDDLTDEQRREYVLVHNKTTMNSDFDFDKLELELDELPNFDVDFYDFDIDFGEEWDEKVEIDDRDPSCQHNAFENQDRMQFPKENYYGIPMMEPTKITGDKLIRFMDWKQCDNPSEYIAHFYYDDYKFISAWREPDKYIERLKKFKAVISPDFSLYMDFPRILQILSCYRRQWVGAYWQYKGLNVIPDVVWGDKESFDYCFEGIPKGGVVAVSSVGVKNNPEWNGKENDLFKAGYCEMLNRVEPCTVILYGSEIGDLEGNVIRVPSYYEENRRKW